MKEFLSLVSKPVRYLGNEIHAIRKDPSEIQLRFCLAFPDVYEVGMSHLGIQILYAILNSRKGISCERVFAPWVDMEQVMREKGLPLSSLETSTALRQFDLIGFSLQYELCFTNVLNMLELSGIPLRAEDRDDRFPVLLSGGPAVYNPAPVEDFFDAFVIGDGEEVILEIGDMALAWKEAGGKKADLLKGLSQLEGVYVPLFHPEGRTVRKRVARDLTAAPFPLCPIVPNMKVIHDRLNMELARGCRRGCRFCQAGFIHRPYRERDPKNVQTTLLQSLKRTGYEEVSLLSLSAGDYASIGPLLSGLMDRFESRHIAVSFPSLRIESVVGHLAREVQRVRKTGFTIAPEAGTERLRKVINKELDERVLFEGLAELFSKGWRAIKLYFMAGLPTETEEDLKGTIDLAKQIASVGAKQRIYPHVNVSVSTFVPKPHTPFQWESQISLEEMKERLRYLKEEAKRNRLQFKWQDPHLSLLEGIFSRGDRRLSRVLIEARQLGCRFDGWSDQFRFPQWKEAFDRAGVEMDSSLRRRDLEALFPWSFIETGVKTSYLRQEYQKAFTGEETPACPLETCRRCGVCNGEFLQVVTHPAPEISSFGRTAKERGGKRGYRQRVQLMFAKRGEMRFISHLELIELFHRASRRAELPLRFSEGFHPLPRIIFTRALPVGVESLKEFVCLELDQRMVPEEVKTRLCSVLPRGIEILGAEEVSGLADPQGFSLRTVYWIPMDHLLPREEADARIQEAMGRQEIRIQQERKGKKREMDIRPLLERVAVKEAEGENRWGIELVLRNETGRAAKPLEIMEAILRIKGETLSTCRIVKLD